MTGVGADGKSGGRGSLAMLGSIGTALGCGCGCIGGYLIGARCCSTELVLGCGIGGLLYCGPGNLFLTMGTGLGPLVAVGIVGLGMATCIGGGSGGIGVWSMLTTLMTSWKASPVLRFTQASVSDF